MYRASLTLIAALLAACQTAPAPETAKSEIMAATQAWVAAFNACDAGAAGALYHPEAVLWGTVAPTIISTPVGIRQYFERVCSASPQPKVAMGEQLVRTFAEVGFNSGYYTFTVFPGGQARQSPARYSFAYRKTDGRWLIVDHHSSVLPAPAQAASAPQR